MRMYLSGPMQGYPAYNVPAFTEAATALRGLGYDVVSPPEEDVKSGIELNTLLDSKDGASDLGPTWGDLLARDVKILADGGITSLVVLPGWEQSKGARLEVFLGMLLRLPLYRYNGADYPIRFSGFEAAHLIFKTLTGV